MKRKRLPLLEEFIEESNGSSKTLASINVPTYNTTYKQPAMGGSIGVVEKDGKKYLLGIHDENDPDGTMIPIKTDKDPKDLLREIHTKFSTDNKAMDDGPDVVYIAKNLKIDDGVKGSMDIPNDWDNNLL